jgi:hypothetical protein
MLSFMMAAYHDRFYKRGTARKRALSLIIYPGGAWKSLIIAGRLDFVVSLVSPLFYGLWTFLRACQVRHRERVGTCSFPDHEMGVCACVFWPSIPRLSVYRYIMVQQKVAEYFGW